MSPSGFDKPFKFFFVVVQWRQQQHYLILRRLAPNLASINSQEMQYMERQYTTQKDFELSPQRAIL